VVQIELQCGERSCTAVKSCATKRRSGDIDNAKNNARVLSRRIQTKPIKTGWLIEWANRCPVW